jgi:hypothetical protein
VSKTTENKIEKRPVLKIDLSTLRPGEVTGFKKLDDQSMDG